MITVLGSPRLTCDGLTRRETLKVGALSLLGGFFNLPSLLALEKGRGKKGRQGKAKSVILLYLQGGPATQDMFDLKPGAPDGIRTDFKPIATNVPGIQVCEHLPKMAQWMHKTAVLRTVHHNGGCHNNLPMYTGYDVPPPDDSPRDTDPPRMVRYALITSRRFSVESPASCPTMPTCPLRWAGAKPAASRGRAAAFWASAMIRSVRSASLMSISP